MNGDLNKVLAGKRLLMLDFDGPICSIFAHYTAPAIAQELRDMLEDDGHIVTEAMSGTDDPLQILRLVADSDGPAVDRVASALRNAEVQAADSAEPTPGVADVIARANSLGLTLAVVSNNSREAVTRYLNRVGLMECFAAVAGRYEGQPPSSLKPDPHLLKLALQTTGTEPQRAVLVGDSITDVLATNAAGVRCVAFRPVREELLPLVDAGAIAAITSMHELADAIPQPQ